MEAVKALKKPSKTNALVFNDKLNEMREYASINNVPIIKDEGMMFLKSIIGLKKPTNVLEIGTAIGYSSSMMALSGTNVYTIERDENMYNEATKNINELGLNDKVHIIFKDALEAFDDVKDIKFDLIFIDAAKAQYTKFFEMYTPLLKSDGAVICDNMLFHDFVDNKEALVGKSRALRGLVRKLEAFHKYLLENSKYETTIYDIGDGMSISVLK